MTTVAEFSDTQWRLPNWTMLDEGVAKKLSGVTAGRKTGARERYGDTCTYDDNGEPAKADPFPGEKDQRKPVRPAPDERVKLRRAAERMLKATSRLAPLPFVQISPSQERVDAFIQYARKESGGLIRELLAGLRVPRKQAERQLKTALVGALESLVERVREGADAGATIELRETSLQTLVDLIADRLGDLSEEDSHHLAIGLVQDLRGQIAAGAWFAVSRGLIGSRGGSIVAIVREPPTPDAMLSNTQRWKPIDARF